MNRHKIHKKLLKVLTKKFLIKEYSKKENSTYKIAKEVNCGQTTIINYLKKFNIKRRKNSKYSNILTKKFLGRELKNKSVLKIAKKVGCNAKSIYHYLEKYNIKIKKSTDILTKKFLIEEYTKNKKYPREIAKECRCGATTISNYLRKYNIKIRTASEAMKGKKNSRFKEKRINHHGYILIWNPNHLFAYKSRVLEHRLVMEAHLNNFPVRKWIGFGLKNNYPKNMRFLKREEVVHHINGKRDDNRIKNLILFPNQRAHQNFIHLNKKTFICKFCGKDQRKYNEQ